MHAKNGQHVSRRNFLKISGAGAATLCLSAVPGLAASPGKAKIPVGLQLYSVRFDCERDLPGTLAAVAGMGYQGVEWAGYYGRTAKELRALLDGNGLKCCGTHTGLDTLMGDKLNQTIEFNKELGNPYLIVPGLPKERTASRQAWLETAQLFNELSLKAEARGMKVGYHNHTVEFEPLEGELPWDTFFGNTRKEVIMQFDTGNAMQGGSEPLAFLKRYPGRALTIHLKEFSKSNPTAFLGEGDVPWKDLFKACETVGGTQWYIVEYEHAGTPPLEAVSHCAENMKKMGKL
jgi:sugar phosphate isomerase/epimerase